MKAIRCGYVSRRRFYYAGLVAILFMMIVIVFQSYGKYYVTISPSKENFVLVPVERTGPVYSSFRCIGGSQTFPNMTSQRTQVGHGWPEANLARNRLCHFENICWVNDQLVFYEDPGLRASTPDYLWPESFRADGHEPMLYLGYLDGSRWSPAIETGPLPESTVINASATFLLGEKSFSDNFAHLLIDDLIPALQGLSMFDFPLDSGLLLSLSGCSRASELYNPDDITPYANRPRKDVCFDNYNTYAPLLLGRPMVDVRQEWKGATVCMRHALAGHSSVFGLRTLDVERAPSFRWARDRIVQGLGLAAIPRPQRHSVAVLSKRLGFAGGSIWATLCEDTDATVRAIDPSIPVRCYDPVGQNLTAQVQSSLESTLVVAEHGTTSYTAMFGHDGLVLVSIADRAMVKDMQINLYLTHVDTYYMAHEDRGTHFEGMLRFALARAAVNFGLGEMIFKKKQKTY
jgi:hypothetical protein